MAKIRVLTKLSNPSLSKSAGKLVSFVFFSSLILIYLHGKNQDALLTTVKAAQVASEIVGSENIGIVRTADGHLEVNVWNSKKTRTVKDKEEKEEPASKESEDDGIVLERRPRFGGPSCSNFTVRLYRPHSWNLTGLASYPGSGNTWLRHLLEFATGVYTGSMYQDFDLFTKGYLGELQPWDSGSTIVQKLHYRYTPELPFPKTVLLVREPYAAAIAFAQYLEGGHVGRAAKEVFNDKGFPKFMLTQGYKWLSMLLSWLNSGTEVHVVHYESLVQKPQFEVGRICKFLNHSCPYLDTKCFKDNLDGQFHRKKSKPLVEFPEIVREKIDKSIELANEQLVKFGHQPLPVALYKYYKRGKRTGKMDDAQSVYEALEASKIVVRNVEELKE